MTDTPVPGLEPVLQGPLDGEARWWGDSLAVIKASGAATDGQLTVIDNYSCAGTTPPLHVHHREGEGFYVVDGTLTFWVGGRVLQASSGSFVYGPPGVPHTFEVTSPTARYLFITTPAGFDGFVREVSDAAEKFVIPRLDRPRQSLDRIDVVSGRYGIEILGPPGIPGTARP